MGVVGVMLESFLAAGLLDDLAVAVAARRSMSENLQP